MEYCHLTVQTQCAPIAPAAASAASTAGGFDTIKPAYRLELDSVLALVLRITEFSFLPTGATARPRHISHPSEETSLYRNPCDGIRLAALAYCAVESSSALRARELLRHGRCRELTYTAGAGSRERQYVLQWRPHGQPGSGAKRGSRGACQTASTRVASPLRKLSSSCCPSATPAPRNCGSPRPVPVEESDKRLPVVLATEARE